MIAPIIGIIFNIIILSYFYKIKKCKCLKNKLESKIQTISLILLTLYTLSFVIFISKITSPKILIVITLLLVFIFQVYQIPLLLKNTNTKEECECRRVWQKPFMRYIAIFYIIVFSLFTLKFIYGKLRYSSMSSKDKQEINKISLINETNKSSVIITRDLQKLISTK